MKKLLDIPIIWKAVRFLLEFLFGIYSKRIMLIKNSKIIGKNDSFLDIGCGSGHFSVLTEGKYLGIDLNEKYINDARKKYADKKFICADVSEVYKEKNKFDNVLLVDILHHLDDKKSIQLLKSLLNISNKKIINFEPISYKNPNPIDKLWIQMDRGEYIRDGEKLDKLFADSGLNVFYSKQVRIWPFLPIKMTILNRKN